jgi:hypothetical protein
LIQLATNHGKDTRMATQRREESERWLKRQRPGIRKEGGDEFKASPTRGRIKEGFILCEDGGYEKEVDVYKDGKRPEFAD